VTRLVDLMPTLGRRTQLMGILNVTPDSFSDGGRYASVDAALAHAERLLADGADVLDVGGETTRPGAEPVPEDVERARVLPVIEALARRGLGPISIDTTKAHVAADALDAGARLVNDISGGTFEPAILDETARRGAAIVLMHTRARPSVMQQGTWTYEGGVVHAVDGALAARAAAAEAAGIPADAIAVDPGIGFGKTLDENLALLVGLDVLAARGRPVLVGTSRKSFLGKLTGRGVDALDVATGASVAWAIERGAAIVRVHDVAAARDVARVTDALVAARAAARSG
jgi:dihydropteroate synthase